MGSYIVYDKVLKEDNSVDTKSVENSKNIKDSGTNDGCECEDVATDEDKEEKTKNDNVATEEETKNEEENVVTEVTIDKDAVNKKILSFESVYYFTFGSIVPGNVKYNVNLLDENSYFDFAWGYAVSDKVQEYVTDINSNGEGEDGAYAIEYNSFASYYEKLLGVTFDGSHLGSKYNCVAKDGMLYYVTYTSSLGMEKQLFRVNNVTKLGNEYTVNIDVLYFGDDSSGYWNYKNESEYPESEVDYKMQIVAVKNGDMYTFKSIKYV